MITINDTPTMHEILSQVMESKRHIKIYIGEASTILSDFEGCIVSLSSQFVEVDVSHFTVSLPSSTHSVICINSIKAISIFPDAKDEGGKK